ncbi:hypothetical protein ACHHYP_03523 [Achlya hypogyna]|uniref:Meckel syndrome type 1 protein n=1 Tax=Achlya hypogyna TaxID=1202772 RepID=A0A1V9Z3G2_ACHHY|nr:hypothetical protein ACHHYP_03523 [Achlya hypogyna]
MALPRYYHVRDPIENLVLQVTLRKVADGDATRAPGAKDEWSRAFRWQEKVFGPMEYCRYNTRASADFAVRDGKMTKPRDAENKHLLAEYQANHEVVIDPTDEVVLYSFTDRDNYLPPTELVRTLSTSTEPLNDMAVQALSLVQRRSYKTMYLMASLDIAPELYRKKKLKRDAFDDHILCALRYYPHTHLLEVRPGFSRSLEPVADHTPLEPTPLQSRQGSHYEYVLINCSDVFATDGDSPQQLALDLHRADDADDDRRRQAYESRCGIAGCTVATASVLYHVDVVAASVAADCDDGGLLLGRPFYLQYVLFMETSGSWVGPPESWDAAHERWVLAAGCSPQCLARQGVLHWSLSLEAIVHEAARPVSPARPPVVRFAAQLFSKDAWERHNVRGYGCTVLPTTAGRVDPLVVPLWMPALSVTARRRDFFVGSEGQLPSMFEQHTAALGVETVPSGSLTVRLQVLMQTRVVEVAAASKELVIVKRGVDEILAKVRASKLHKNSGDHPPSAVGAVLADLRAKRLLPAS